MNEYQKSWIKSKTKENKISMTSVIFYLLIFSSCSVIILHYTKVQQFADWAVNVSYVFMYVMLCIMFLGRLVVDVFFGIGLGMMLKRDNPHIITRKQYKEVSSLVSLQHSKTNKFHRKVGYFILQPLILFSLAININFLNILGIVILFIMFVMGIIGLATREHLLGSVVQLLSLEAVSELEAAKDEEFEINLKEFETDDD